MAGNTFALKFIGQDVSPETLRLRDLYDVLHAFEAAVSATSIQGFGGPAIDLHLSHIGDGSVDCLMSVNAVGYQSAALCAQAIASRNLSPLPLRARDNLLAMQNKARIKGWTFQISDGNGMPPAEIGPETEFITDSIVTGQSSLIGWIHRVGGIENPTAHMLLPNLTRFTASISSQTIAAELGKLLYRMVTVDGEARWAMPDWRLVDFKITSIAGIDQDAELLATLEKLAEIAGDAWDDIDPDEYVSSLRSDEM